MPFLCAGCLALIFTRPFALLIEDEASSSHSSPAAVGLSEREREWSTRSHLCYYRSSPADGRHRRPDQPLPAPDVPKQVIWCVSYRPWSLLATCSSTFHLAHTRPHSLTTLTYESTTHTSTTGSTHAIYGKLDHAPTCASAFFRSLVNFTSCFLIALRNIPMTL